MMRLLAAILLFTTLTSFGQEKNPIKLGLGVVAIRHPDAESKFVPLYQDKDCKNKIQDFKLLYKQLGRVWPYYFKPDYGLCYFVCLEKNQDYYKILINDKEEGFLKNDHDKYFKTWESILINASVERLDIKANPLRLDPSDYAGTISLGYEAKVDRLQVIDVIELNGEHWLNVSYSKSGQVPCEYGTPDCGHGWIKWKKDDKLLVKILLLS